MGSKTKTALFTCLVLAGAMAVHDETRLSTVFKRNINQPKKPSKKLLDEFKKGEGIKSKSLRLWLKMVYNMF